MKNKFIIVVPLINLIGDSLLAATEASGSFHSGNIRAVILVLYISYYFLYFRIKLNKTDVYVFLFMVYLACVVILNYNYINIALTTSLKIFIIFSLLLLHTTVSQIPAFLKA